WRSRCWGARSRTAKRSASRYATVRSRLRARSRKRRRNPPLSGPRRLPCRLLLAARFAEFAETFLVGGVDAPVTGAPHRTVLVPGEGRFHRRARAACGLQQ